MFVTLDGGKMKSNGVLKQTMPRQLPHGVDQKALDDQAKDIKQSLEGIVYVQIII